MDRRVRGSLNPEEIVTVALEIAEERDDRGSLRAGNVPDPVVLDREPFDGPPAAIGATSVAATQVSGRPVSRAA